MGASRWWSSRRKFAAPSQVISTLEDVRAVRLSGCCPRAASPAPDKARPPPAPEKLFYELAAHREQAGAMDVAIIPPGTTLSFARRLLEQALNSCADNTPALWVQEEPANMGAWRYRNEALW